MEHPCVVKKERWNTHVYLSLISWQKKYCSLLKKVKTNLGRNKKVLTILNVNRNRTNALRVYS